MKNSQPDFVRQLLQKAENDLSMARIGLAHAAPFDTISFHVQQAAEKLLKAGLAAKDVDYPFTHELRELMELAIPLYPFLAEFRATLPAYTEFAVRFRYDDLPWVTEAEVRDAFEVVSRLRDQLVDFLGV